MDKKERDRMLKAMGIDTFDGKTYITENGKTRIEYMKIVDSDGNETDPEVEFLTKQLIIACSFVSNKPTLTRGQDEDTINCLVRDNLKLLFIDGEYSVPDQSKQGSSESRKSSGEVDIIIEQDQRSVALVEALNHGTKSDLHKHIKKAIDNYNPTGIENVFILSYSRGGAPFDKFWGELENWASDEDGINVWGRIKTGYDAIRCLEGRYDHNGIKGKIFFIGVNVQ